MLRKIIAAAALAASAAIATVPGAALAQDREHRGWQTQGNYGGRHGNSWVGRGGHGQGAYDRHYVRSNGNHGDRSYDNGNGYHGNRGYDNGNGYYRQQGGHDRRSQSYGYDQNGYGGHDREDRGH